MHGWLHRGRALFGAAALCIAISGCAAQHDDSLRLSEELGHARADAAWQGARAAEFESRMSRLEQRADALLSAQRAEDRLLANRLDRLIAMNERLLAERGAGTPPVGGIGPNEATAAPRLHPIATSVRSTLCQEQELRALVERMRGSPGSPHGGLSREQEDALRVLTRPERKLDTESPWSTAIY